jgi:tryptophanyl-tRNA synthetase
MFIDRVLSGMRPTGSLHLGHYHGVLKNWVELQHEFECLFFVADWHALTTHYDAPEIIGQNIWSMVVDWLAAGVDPAQATLFIQSRIPAHAELHVLLSMITPLGWLERVPTYKDQQEKMTDKDLSTYGFLGYPLLQSADILIYRANRVPVGEDQTPHIEFTREISRRFNHIYGKEVGFREKAELAIKKLGSKKSNIYRDLRNRYQEQGDNEALNAAKSLLDEQQNLSMGDRERLFGYLEGGGKMILSEPEAMLAQASKMPGLDGQKMSKSYNNTISLREGADSVTIKIRTMQTDPARIRRGDPGDPAKCPVWQFHLVYSNDTVRDWVQHGCKSAGIGCLECKQPVIEAVLAEQQPMHERARMYEEDPTLVRNIIADGCEKADKLAQETMRDVREAMGLSYS